MDEFVGVGFEAVALGVAELVFAGAAPFAAAVDEVVGDVAEADVAFGGVEAARGIAAVRILRAVERPARDEGCELGGRDAVELMMKDVIDALLQVGKLIRQSRDEPLCDFAQEDTALATDVEESRLRIAEEFRRQQIKHVVHHLRRREHFVIREIRETRKNIRIVLIIHRQASSSRWARTSSTVRESSAVF